MAKSIRLLNVDYIVTSSDKTIDLNNLSSSAGNPHAADGHSGTASHAMIAGGNGTAVSTQSFSSGSTASPHTTLTVGGLAPEAGSDGANAVIGISSGSVTNRISFANSSTAQSWNSKVVYYRYRASASNRTYMLLGGGWYSSTYYNDWTTVSMSDPNLTSYKSGQLTAGKEQGAAASSGELCMFVAGMKGGTRCGEVELRSIDTDENSSLFHSLATARGPLTACSNGSVAMVIGNWVDITPSNKNTELLSFSSAGMTPHAELTVTRTYAGAASDGSTAFINGGWTNGTTNTFSSELISFDTSAVAEGHGSLTHGGYAVGVCSGTP